MKKLFCIVGSAMLLGGGSIALADVVGSVHDLTTATGTAFSTTGNTADVCVFCHTPHGAAAGDAPLWNRQLPSGPYTMYNNSFSSTIDMIVAGSPQGVSLACLSCHDGTIAFDVLVNAPTSVSGTYNYTAGGASQAYTFTGANSLNAQGLPLEFGTTLTNQHPISVTYDPAQDAAFDTIANAEADGVVFYGSGANQVECGSCHDPHTTTFVPFLRASNAASALCRACHLK